MEYKWINPDEITDLEGKSVVLFGAGAGSEEFLHYRQAHDMDTEIVCVTDNDRTYWGRRFLHYDIIAPGELKHRGYDKIVVTSATGRHAIADQLDEMGFGRDADYCLIGRYPQTYYGNFNVFLKSFGGTPDLDGKRCLHVGPGGFLGIEILLCCLGAKEVYAVDLLSLGIHYPDVSDSINDYAGIKECITALDIGGGERQHALRRFDGLFVHRGNRVRIDTDKIKCVTPMDMCRLSFPDNTFDLLLSFSVLEHVMAPESALSEACRVLKPGAESFQTICTRDHRTFSKAGGFTPFSYRSHGSDEWEEIASRRFYQNRLLPVEWKRLHDENGLDVIGYAVECRFDLDEAQRDAFHPDFKRFSRKELEEADCRILSRKKGAP